MVLLIILIYHRYTNKELERTGKNWNWEVKMEENITSKKLIVELDKVIQNYIDIAKAHNRKPTRDEIIETVTIKLEELLKLSSENKERTWIISGIAVGIAISLHIDDKLKLVE